MHDTAELGTILGIWAHPDDDIFCSAGLMATAVRSGQRVVDVTATRGEGGSMDEERWPPESMGEVRTKELLRSLEILGVTEHRFLDGPVDLDMEEHLDEAGAAQVRAIVEEIAARHDPHVRSRRDDRPPGAQGRLALGRPTRSARSPSPSARLFYATQTPAFVAEVVPALEQFNIFLPGTPPVTEPADLGIAFRATTTCSTSRSPRSRRTRARSRGSSRCSASRACAGSCVTSPSETFGREAGRRTLMGAVSEQTKTIIGRSAPSASSAPTRRSGRRCADPRRATSCSATRTMRAPQAYVDALVRGRTAHRQGPLRLHAWICRRRSPRSGRICADGSACRVPRRGHPPDERQLRRARDRAPHPRRPRRRGDLRLAAVVLLRDLDRRGGRHARAGVADRARTTSTWTSRRSRRRSRRATRAIIVNSPAQPVRADLHAGPAHRARRDPRDGVERATISASSCSPTRRTTGSCSSRTRSRRRSPTTRTRSCLYTYAKTLLAPGLAARLPRVAARHARGRRGAARCPADRADHAADGPIRCRCCSTRCPTSTRWGPTCRPCSAAATRWSSTLREQGYEVVEPQGTFYILVRSPIEDDRAVLRGPAVHTTCSCCRARCSRCRGGSASR